MTNILSISPTILTIVIVGIVLVFCISIVFVLIALREKKTLKTVFNFLQNLCIRRGIEGYQLQVSDNKAYDFYFEAKSIIYYIKVVFNFSCAEICVNNKVKWQIKTSPLDNSAKMVEGIADLMELELPANPKKTIKKLFIIYPNSKTLLKYINECEMNFIYSNTDVYGANIINFSELKENDSIFEAK